VQGSSPSKLRKKKKKKKSKGSGHLPAAGDQICREEGAMIWQGRDEKFLGRDQEGGCGGLDDGDAVSEEMVDAAQQQPEEAVMGNPWVSFLTWVALLTICVCTEQWTFPEYHLEYRVYSRCQEVEHVVLGDEVPFAADRCCKALEPCHVQQSNPRVLYTCFRLRYGWCRSKRS
jgi:hypothetical protein